MSDHLIELFVLKCAVVETNLRSALAEAGTRPDAFESAVDQELEPLIKQFEVSNRRNARKMSRYYEIFYMLENDMRRLIVETMETAHGPDWWETKVPDPVLAEVRKNIENEQAAGVTARSDWRACWSRSHA